MEYFQRSNCPWPSKLDVTSPSLQPQTDSDPHHYHLSRQPTLALPACQHFLQGL